MARNTIRSKNANTSKVNFRKIVQIVRKAMLWFLAVTITWVLFYRFVNPPITWLMIQRGIERKIDGKEWKVEKKWRSFDDQSNNLKIGAVAGEDVRFLTHWGFDVKSIQRAYKKNQTGKKVSGGSTISQQTAKNVFLWPGRSWIRKGFEVYFTALIELLWNKKRIIEVYLNVIEMGDGVYGAEAATLKYYHKSAGSLTKGEAALLIAVLPNPIRWIPAKPTRYIYKRQRLILSNMRRIRKIKFD